MSDVHSGNFASGQTDEVIQCTLREASKRALLTGAPGSSGSPVYKYPKPSQCPPVYISPYSGGATSSIFLKNRMESIAICTAAQNLAVAKLRQIPGCPVNLATRFVQYQRYQPPAPCPVSTINPAIPAAINGPCTNVIGSVQTWPPH